MSQSSQNGFRIDPSTFDECDIPDYMRGAIVRYYENGIPPGSFLQSVIDNDLREACGRADSTNRHALFNYVNWFYNHAPSGTWGYQGATAKYIEAFRRACQQGEKV